MAKGYWIIRLDVDNMESFQKYLAATPAVLKEFGGRFVVRGGAHQVPEGTTRSRNSVIEFPSYQAALDCWSSPGYAEARALRQMVSTMDLVIIEGYEGPQPDGASAGADS